ncbi:MAG: prolyl oligopeptidase family serine peptidase [Oscillospiraceae bacterium]|nr:prolyl oligopeptidase family serine peptidase [Oscillospiraceae bacterium]
MKIMGRFLAAILILAVFAAAIGLPALSAARAAAADTGIHIKYPPYPAQQGVPGSYTPQNFFNLVTDGFRGMYQLHRPAAPQAGKKYPVLICLHGAGEGNNVRAYPNVSLTSSIILDNLRDKINSNPAQYESYVVLPIDYTVQGIKAIIDRLVSQEQADPDRIYITGCSMGGFTTCDFIFAYPAVPACAVPVCGCNYYPELAKGILNMPIRVYHSADDPVVSVSTSRDFYKNLKALGDTNIAYFETNGYGHGCWEYAYRTDVLEWMYKQNRQIHALWGTQGW